MTGQSDETSEITSDILLRAYSAGIFPMAESADDPSIHWIEPRMRGVIPLDGFHVSNKLRRLVKSDRLTVRINRNFSAVIEGCAEAAPDRPSTWINSRIKALYITLHDRGACHSVEVYDGGALVGGLYGVQLGAAFFGESMFHRTRDASKVALVHLVCRLRAGGFTLLDTQFITAQVLQFGAIEIPAEHYRRKLKAALAIPAEFDIWRSTEPMPGSSVLQALGTAAGRL